jgi:Tfp pilus assembly protein PilV
MRLPAKSAGSIPGARPPRRSLRVGSLVSRARRRASQEDGFTIVETIVATIVLTIGLLTTYLMLAVSVHASSEVRQREEGVSLARQIAEDARSIPYSQLSNATIVTQLQAYPGLANSGSPSTWTIVRGGYTYTVAASLTTLNDPKDTSGATDVKQFSVTVSWATYQAQTHTYTESAIMSRAGQDPGLAASALALATTGAGISGPTPNTAPVITSTGITSLQFSVTAPAGTQAIVWSLNGSKQSSWTGSIPSTGTTWTSAAWSLSGLSDGNYTVGAQAEDANGVDGPGVTIPVRLIRNVPSAPSITGDGFNTNLRVSGTATTVAELQWNTNPELNVVGYRIYSPSGAMICQTNTTSSYGSSCGANAYCTSLTACIDLTQPPATTSPNPPGRTYSVRALYYDANNNLQEGSASNVTLASGIPTPPPAPVSLTVATQLDATATLTWPVSVGGTPVSFYRVYRDGTNYTTRYDVVAASSCAVTCSYHDTSRAEGHLYYVTAVGGTTPGSNMAESPFSPGQTG